MSSSGSLGGGFSFDTPEAIMHVLASVRNSELPPHDKNQLRDLILSYTNGGKDPSLKIQIEQKLQSHGVAPAALTVALGAAPSPEFGSSRGVPTFKPGRFVAASAPATPPAAVPSAPTQAVPPPAPQAPAPANVPVAQPAPEPIPAAAPAPAPEPMVDTAALTRIREIKALVNEQVGNPVNLVDIDNEVGREYMTALLDAMKKLNAGSGSGPAMERLESAYVAVEAVIKKHAASEAAQAPSAAAEVSTPPVVSTPEPTPTPQLVATETPVNPPAAEPVSAPEASRAETTTADDSRWNTPTTAETTTPVAKPTVPGIKPLSESRTPIKSVADLPASDSLAEAGGDSLRTKEVEDGLQQLLTDWVLFKKSGLFGTGPNGTQHPLYIKIKDLQIPLLLAGRFEGATQEIKQSITDYMNGWRYEQGIIYEQGETFDHYLRRVIRHILDLQK